jgi:hypothetical protein
MKIRWALPFVVGLHVISVLSVNEAAAKPRKETAPLVGAKCLAHEAGVIAFVGGWQPGWRRCASPPNHARRWMEAFPPTSGQHCPWRQIGVTPGWGYSCDLVGGQPVWNRNDPATTTTQPQQ